MGERRRPGGLIGASSEKVLLTWDDMCFSSCLRHDAARISRHHTPVTRLRKTAGPVGA